ncbi:hypothetical protein [Streptomyces anulatus]
MGGGSRRIPLQVGVRIVQYRDRAKPSLGITTTSGCYEVPEGVKAEKF